MHTILDGDQLNYHINFNIVTMTEEEARKNEKLKNIEEIAGEAKIEFPVTFNLKAVLSNNVAESNHMLSLKQVFDNLNVTNSYIDKKRSGKGTYTSYNYKVTLVDKAQLEKLYADLKEVPGLKFAL